MVQMSMQISEAVVKLRALADDLSIMALSASGRTDDQADVLIEAISTLSDVIRGLHVAERVEYTTATDPRD